MKDFVFISGMPRSGSTIGANLLAQNPRFHSTQTSGCLDIIFGVRNTWDKLIEHQAHKDDLVQKNVLRGILNSYYEHIEKSVIFEKSRGWTAYIEMAEDLIGKKVKILVPIRSLPDILASFEKLHRSTSATKQPPGEAENYFQMQTVEGRCEYWCRADNVVGLAFSRIKDAIQRGFRDRMHPIDFNRLTSNPRQVLKEVYDFLAEEWFEHNFNYVEQVTTEDDSVHGYVNLHKIRNKIEPVPSCAEEILGKELVEKYKNVKLEF